MKTEELRFEDQELGLEVRLCISQATVLMGMKRSRLKREGIDAGEEDVDRHLLRIFTYPDLSAATVVIEGLSDFDFEAFLLLPDSLIAQWEDAVYRLNPHWLPTEPEPEDGDPNPPTPSTGD